MRRQRGISFDWIVVDDGESLVDVPEAVVIRRRPSGTRYTNAANVLEGVNAARGDVLMYIEDDDWISATYVRTMTDHLVVVDAAAISGLVMYHAGVSVFQDKRILPDENHRMTGLGAFAIRGPTARSMLTDALKECVHEEVPLIDMAFWRRVRESDLTYDLFQSRDLLCIKGIPGRSITYKHHTMPGIKDRGNKFLVDWVGREDAELILRSASGWREWRTRWIDRSWK